MFPSLQSTTPNLQGGYGGSIQGTSFNVQPAQSNPQPAAGVQTLYNPNAYIGSTGVLGDFTDTGAVSSTQQPAPAIDPYAQWGGQDKYNNLVSGFNTQRDVINSTTDTAGNTAANKYNQGILGFLDTLRAAQTGIDRQGQQNELAKIQGTQGVLGMVGRGIKSGGIMLANKNAGDSSAAGALAKAYGDIGRRQLTGIGNQYAQSQNAIGNAQSDLAIQQASGLRTLGSSKEDLVSGIVTAAQNSLATLDAAMVNASLPDRIDIEAEKNRIKQEALGKLAQYDTTLNQGVAGVAPASQEANRNKAQELAFAGTAPENAFSFTDQVPAQFQGTGGFPSSLPLFQFPSRNKQIA